MTTHFNPNADPHPHCTCTCDLGFVPPTRAPEISTSPQGSHLSHHHHHLPGATTRSTCRMYPSSLAEYDSSLAVSPQDSQLLQSSTGVRAALLHGRKHPHPVLQQDRPWEDPATAPVPRPLALVLILALTLSLALGPGPDPSPNPALHPIPSGGGLVRVILAIGVEEKQLQWQGDGHRTQRQLFR